MNPNRSPDAAPKKGPIASVPSEAGRKEKASARGKPEEIVVFLTRHNGKCAECGTDLFDGAMIRLEQERPHCLDCGDLGHLEFLARGNTALTRRATKHSPLRAVVVQWSRARQRYERQGILVTGEAIDRAEQECHADADVRARQRERAAVRREGAEKAHVAEVIALLRAAFPACPPGEAEGIAAWTCQKHSGRVGRSAAAKALDPAMLRLAVIARIRHEYTGYDRLLMQLGDRRAARAAVGPEIDRILAQWEAPGGPTKD